MSCESSCEKICKQMRTAYRYKDHFSVTERAQWSDPRIGSIERVKVKIEYVDERKLLKLAQDKESREKISRAQSYICTLGDIFQGKKHEEARKRAEEVRKVVDTYELNSAEAAQAFSTVLNKRIAPGTIRYIYQFTGKNV